MTSVTCEECEGTGGEKCIHFCNGCGSQCDKTISCNNCNGSGMVAYVEDEE